MSQVVELQTCVRAAWAAHAKAQEGQRARAEEEALQGPGNGRYSDREHN